MLDVADLPQPVIAKLAGMAHRAECAEAALQRERRRTAELHGEVTLLRSIVSEMQSLATELQERAGDVALVAKQGSVIVRSVAEYEAAFGPRVT
jgi:hypothetical protein